MRYPILTICVLLGCVSGIWGNCAPGKGMKNLTTGGTCESCNLDNCANCSANWTTCDMCMPEHTLVSGKCESCKVSSCGNCDGDINKCSNSMPGYYYKDDTNECLRCSSNCIICYSEGCIECDTGYYLHPDNGGCHPCIIDNCAYCNSTNVLPALMAMA